MLVLIESMIRIVNHLWPFYISKFLTLNLYLILKLIYFFSSRSNLNLSYYQVYRA